MYWDFFFKTSTLFFLGGFKTEQIGFLVSDLTDPSSSRPFPEANAQKRRAMIMVIFLGLAPVPFWYFFILESLKGGYGRGFFAVC